VGLTTRLPLKWYKILVCLSLAPCTFTGCCHIDPMNGISALSKCLILKSSHPLPWWQLCTRLAFAQPASWEMLFQPSWRSSHICWAVDGCLSFNLRSNSSQTISNWVEVGWLWRPGYLMQHSITLFGQIDLTPPGGVFWSLSRWKTNDSPTKCKPDGMAYRCRILW
jgi:hypothetical protein